MTFLIVLMKKITLHVVSKSGEQFAESAVLYKTLKNRLAGNDVICNQSHVESENIS